MWWPAVATDVATSLRRQIHRQMYRLGQSSLPTEGIGPVINLWTREVNDVRDGLIADLDLTPRIQVLAVRLAGDRTTRLATFDDFPGVAGFVRLADRTDLEPRRATGDGVGASRRVGPALPAPRRSGPAPDGQDLWRGRLRPPAVRRTPGSVPPGRRAADHHQRPDQPQHRPALWRRPDDRAGAAGL